jgi:hypothetical protein
MLTWGTLLDEEQDPDAAQDEEAGRGGGQHHRQQHEEDWHPDARGAATAVAHEAHARQIVTVHLRGRKNRLDVG